MVDQKSIPTVSVVMPTYNRAHLLPDVISSILDQDYTDLELLIVDDGSTDQTEQIVKTIQEKDNRLRYCKLNENKGIGYARQFGLEQLQGKYIALADSDDIWLPGKLSLQVKTLEVYPEIEILFSDYLNINHINGIRKRGFKHTLLGLQCLSIRESKDDLYFIKDGIAEGISIANFIAVPTVVFNSVLLDKIGGFNIDLFSATDHEFAFRAAILDARFAYTDKILIERHVYRDSDTADKIRASEWLIQSLIICWQLCESLLKHDVQKYVNDQMHRVYISLMIQYAQVGNRKKVLECYGKAKKYESLQNGNLKDYLLFLVSFGGPSSIKVFEKIRKIMKND